LGYSNTHGRTLSLLQKKVKGARAVKRPLSKMPKGKLPVSRSPEFQVKERNSLLWQNAGGKFP
jgi:hypothetical protein